MLCISSQKKVSITIQKIKMKRLVLVLVVLVTAVSCKKEEIKPQTQEPIGTQQEQVLKIKLNK